MVTAREAEALLQGLLEQYSPSRRESGAVVYLVRRMAELGFQAWVDGAGNAVGLLGEGETTVLLLGHIDTVPGYISVRRHDGRLYGRGAVDAKGPLATFVVAAARAGARANRRIMVVGAVEEEAATSKGARYLLSRVSPSVVVIGEPSGWDRVTVAYRGRLLIDYEVHQEIGHTAGPNSGACEAAVTFWRRVQAYAEAFNRDRRRVFDRLDPSLRTMHAEQDGFIETASLTIGLRLPQGVDLEALKADLKGLTGGGSVRFYGAESAYRASKATPLARAFVRAIDEEGGRLQFKVKSGTSDMNVVGPVWQVPILAYGPGDSSLDHTPREFIELQEYHRAIAVLTRVLQEL